MKPPQHTHRRFDRPFLDLDPVMLLSTLLVGALLTAVIWDRDYAPDNDAASAPVTEEVTR